MQSLKCCDQACYESNFSHDSEWVLTVRMRYHALEWTMALNYHEMLLLGETAFNSVKVSNKES